MLNTQNTSFKKYSEVLQKPNKKITRQDVSKVTNNISINHYAIGNYSTKTEIGIRTSIDRVIALFGVIAVAVVAVVVLAIHGKHLPHQANNHSDSDGYNFYDENMYADITVKLKAKE